MLVLQFVVLSAQSEESASETELSSASLPNIWEDEVVSRMVRDVLKEDLVKEQAHKQQRRQHKRDIQVTASSVFGTTPRTVTTRRVSASTQKAKKPSKVTQTGNKTKNRVTPSTTTTKATVKPSTKPIVPNLGVNSANSSKVKVRNRFDNLKTWIRQRDSETSSRFASILTTIFPAIRMPRHHHHDHVLCAHVVNP